MKGGYRPELPEPRAGRAAARDMVTVPAGAYPIGTDAHAPYDNEHPRHEVRLGAFEIDRFPVTCGDYQRFIEDGSYGRRDLWSEAGWEWVEKAGIEAPKHWRRDGGGGWVTDRFGHVVEVEADVPVMHVSYHEADAYARWAGKRLPTEFEWEVAAAWEWMRKKPLARGADLTWRESWSKKVTSDHCRKRSTATSATMARPTCRTTAWNRLAPST